MKFWKKKEKAGEILIYKLNKNNLASKNNNSKEYINYVNVGPSHSLINSIKTETEIWCLYLSPDNKYLIVSYFDGFIEIYQISDDQSAISTQVISLLVKIQINTAKNRLLNIGFNPLTNYIYTACYKENKIGVSFIDSKNMIKTIIGGENELLVFSYLYKNNILNDIVITLDINGRFIIGTIKNDNKNIELLFVSLNQLPSISLFKVNWDIYIGNKDGDLDVLNCIFQNNSNEIKVQRIFTASLTKDFSNKNKFTKMILGNYPSKIKDVAYNPNKKELFIALHNGTIQIYSHFKNFAECVYMRIYNI